MLFTLSDTPAHAARWLLAAAVAFASLGLCPCPAPASTPAAAADSHECCESGEAPSAPAPPDDGCSHCAPSDTPLRLAASDQAAERLVSAGSFPLPPVLLGVTGWALEPPVAAGREAWPALRPEQAPAQTLRALHTLLLV
ncbi:hypothetical protein [Phycisphaera mikurensis]|uniref:Uncharacterized protein n=1 Tax=Phycisphaera mikurensis (strain NBRC 102666 / KCTC 22515 / FYK2301M01) TaxID=1142394 RepID=I0IJF4_PHYMF|nr:hypothetical protein [Phycisphaera mikurensis]MBB6443142.1 hypothetical protein [Phycisphaera mikurensis]BAM05392.1 hypothetical protein PSMK_p00300 [Phycisphaera mikurensis NBRC 102666]